MDLLFFKYPTNLFSFPELCIVFIVVLRIFFMNYWVGIERATNPVTLWVLLLFIFSTLAYFQKKGTLFGCLMKDFLTYLDLLLHCSLTLYKAQLYNQTLGSLLLHSHLLSATLSCQIWSPAQNKLLFMFWFQVPWPVWFPVLFSSGQMPSTPALLQIPENWGL